MTEQPMPPRRPTPAQERATREAGLPPKTTRDAEQDVTAGEAPDTPTFGDRPEAVSPADEQTVRDGS